MQVVDRCDARTLAIVGSRMPIRIARIAIVTSSSIRLKPRSARAARMRPPLPGMREAHRRCTKSRGKCATLLRSACWSNPPVQRPSPFA